MKKIYLILIFFSVHFLGTAQVVKLKGTILDSLDNSPLPGATILLNYGQMNLVSDKNGHFEVSLPSNVEFTLVVRYVGYVAIRKTLLLKENTETKIFLNKVSNQLDAVIISAKSSQNLKRPILGVSSLNIKTLQKLPTALGETDILRGLQMLPGVSSVGEASNGVNIRGGTTDQNLMLLDDAPIFNPTHMFGLFSAFPSDAVASFDLYKGNVPARFGGRAAAVLDVTLAQPELDKFKMEGGISLVANRLKINTPLIKDKMGLMISARAALNDWMLPIVSKKLKDIKSNFGDGAAKWFYIINPKNTLTASAYYSYDNFQTEALGTIGDINAVNTQYEYQTLNFSTKWLYLINDKLNIQTSLVSSQYDPIIKLPELDTDNKVRIEQSIDYQKVASNLNYYKDKHQLEMGLDMTRYVINPGKLVPGSSTSVLSIITPIEKGIELGASIEDEITFSKKTTLSVGLRYSSFLKMGPSDELIYEQGQERNEFSLIDTVSYGQGDIAQNYGGFEPRIGFRWLLSKNTSLKFGYNMMRQYLQVVSNTTTPIPTSRWKTSDAYIKPQISNLYTAGYFQELDSKIYEFSLEAYYRFTDNIIDYKSGASFLLQQHPETELLQGVNKSYGVEFMLSKKKGEATGWLNYTWARSFNKVSEGEGFTQQINFGNWYAANYDRPHTVNAALVLNQGEHHDFSFNFTYSTGRPYTSPQGFIRFSDNVYPFYAIRNNARIPDYHRLDFAWNIYNPAMRAKRFKGNWTFTVYNLYGRANAYSIFLRSEGNVAKTYKLTVFGSPIVSLSYNFKFM